MNSLRGSTSARVSSCAKWFASIGLMLMTAIIAWQVFARYALNASPAWAEQAALLLMIWYVFIAAAAGVREGFHIRIGAFADRLRGPLRKPIRVISQFVILLFGVAMAYWGMQLALATWDHTIPTLGISRAFAYVPIAISGLLISAFAAEQVIAVLRSVEVDSVWS